MTAIPERLLAAAEAVRTHNKHGCIYSAMKAQDEFDAMAVLSAEPLARIARAAENLADVLNTGDYGPALTASLAALRAALKEMNQ